MDPSDSDENKYHIRNISHPYNCGRYLEFLRNEQLNRVAVNASSGDRSHLLSSDYAGNASSSGYNHNIARYPTRVMSDEEYRQRVFDSLNRSGCASGSNSNSQSTKHHDHSYITSYDPFVEGSSGQAMEVEEDDFWGDDILEENHNAEETGDMEYPVFKKPLTPKEKLAKAKALARKAKTSQGVVDPVDSSDKGKSIVRHYEKPITRQTSNKRKGWPPAQDESMLSDVDGLETQSAPHSGQHQSVRSSYSVKRDLVVWDVHWDQLMMMNLVAKVRQHGLDPVLQEAVSEMSQTLSVDGYMQHYTKLYSLRKKCGMKLPKLPPGHSEPTMTETTASMNLLLPQEGLHLRLKALERQFKEDKEERESGLTRDVNNDGDFEPSRRVRDSIISSFSRAETAAMVSKRCLAHFKQKEEKSDEAVVPSSSKRGPGRPRKLSTGHIWWTSNNNDAPVEVDSSSGTCVASTIPDVQGANVVSTILNAPTAPAAPAAPSVPEEPLSRFACTIPPTPIPSEYIAFSAPVPKNGANKATTPRKVSRKKSFPVMEWFSDRKKRNTPNGQTVAAQELEDTPIKKSKTSIPSAAQRELLQSQNTQEDPASNSKSSSFNIFKKRGQANKTPAKQVTMSSLYPHTQTMQPPAYQKPLNSRPAQSNLSQYDLAPSGAERLTAYASDNNNQENGFRNISDQGLMIQDSIPHSQYNSGSYSEMPNPYGRKHDQMVAVPTNEMLAKFDERIPDDQLNDRFERELSLEDSPKTTFKPDKRQQLKSTEIIRLGDPNFGREIPASSRERPSNFAGVPSEAALKKKWNKLPSIDSVISPRHGQAQFGSGPPPIPLRSHARKPHHIITDSPVQPQQATVSSFSPDKMFSPCNDGASPLLTRQMKNTPYYSYIPPESTPIAPSEEWQQSAPRN